MSLKRSYFLELSVVGCAVGQLEVAHSGLDPVLVKVADEEAPVVVGVRAALAVLLLQSHHLGKGEKGDELHMQQLTG